MRSDERNLLCALVDARQQTRREDFEIEKQLLRSSALLRGSSLEAVVEAATQDGEHDIQDD